MKNKVKIVTGKIQSGKTTNLFKFVNNHQSIDGILSPIVNDKRVLYHIATKTIKIFEVDSESKQTVSIGDYIFLKETFDWANEKLIKGFYKKPDYLIIDEIGKLELKTQGFYPSVKEIFKIQDNQVTQLILVIRDYLVDQALNLFNIRNDQYEILKF